MKELYSKCPDVRQLEWSKKGNVQHLFVSLKNHRVVRRSVLLLSTVRAQLSSLENSYNRHRTISYLE